MVERAEQDDHVGGGVRLGNGASISHLRGEEMLGGLGIGRLLCLLDVKRQQVVQMNVVAAARPDRGVRARAASTSINRAGADGRKRSSSSRVRVSSRPGSPSRKRRSRSKPSS